MRRLHLLITIPANNPFYYNLGVLGIFYHSLTYTLRSLLKGTYTYKFLPLTFLPGNPVIINGCYTLFISLYRY